MAELRAHQREVAALARTQSALLSCAAGAGKSFLSSWLLAEALGCFASAAGGASDRREDAHAVAVAPGRGGRLALQKELVRMCGVPVVGSDDEGGQERGWWRGGQWTKQVSVLSPVALLDALRAGDVRALESIALLVVEDFDQVHAELPAFFPTLFQQCPSAALRVFATTRQPLSKLNWRPGGSPLFGRVQALNMISMVAPSVMAATSAPLMCESFADAAIEPFDVKSFLLGQNSKRVDLIGVFRRELELGNSKATLDDKVKQDRVSRFIADAEVVYTHLGMWCLWKYVELELQSNLLACTIEVEPKRLHRDSSGEDVTMDDEKQSDDGLLVPESDEQEEGEVEETTADSDKQLFAKVLGPKVVLDPEIYDKVRPIAKVIVWVGLQANKCGTQAASLRLLKTAQVVRQRWQNTANKNEFRAWVFVVRRCHARVVSEYLWEALKEQELPPPCSMLGNTSARVCGCPHFSSHLKIMKMFHSFQTRILVTTSMKRTSQDQRVEPPPVSLVVVMDEILEPDKLLDFVGRADVSTGVVIYLTGDSPSQIQKFNLLKAKMADHARQVEADRPRISTTPGTPNNAHQPSEPSVKSADGALNNGPRTSVPAAKLPIRTLTVPNPQQPSPSSKYEIRYEDTGAVLNILNSVQCLTSFCETLPGFDTYDRHPEYKVKRIPLTSAMSASAKRYKKKKLKYNSKLNDKIDELAASTSNVPSGQQDDADSIADDEGEETNNRFHYSASLRLPGCLGIRKQFLSPKVETEAEAKGICAFQACEEISRKGLLDRHFRSKLIDDDASAIHRGANPGAAQAPASILVESSSNQTQLADMSTQSSYDLPPVSAAELNLRPIRSLTKEASEAANGEDWTATLCLYALSGVGLAILATDELYTGNTNMGWRYDFAMCGVLDGEIKRLALEKRPIKLSLSKQQLHDALHFHLVVMRLACMTVADAVRDIDIDGENVWNEFSEQNDKGYLVVPSVMESSGTYNLDWDYVNEIITHPLLEPVWPLPSSPTDEWVLVPEHRQNVTYIVQNVTEEKVPEIRAKYLADDEEWAKHVKKGKSTPGKPILGRWHSREMLEQAEDDQPLLYCTQVPQIVPLIRRVMQRNHDEGSMSKLPTNCNERLLIPQYSQRLRLTKSQFFDAMGFVPVLYEFERKCQISNLMQLIGLEVDMTLLDDATTKPAYERLEILGDTFLKLETSWFMYENRKDIVQEGFLTKLRRDIIRNDRLNQFAIRNKLHHYMLYPAEVEQHPFKCWKPSCMGKTPEPVVAPAKWVADVLEAICGAYLIGQGEKGARHFLRWVGVSVLEEPMTFAQKFYPACFPNELYDYDVDMVDARATHPLSINFTSAQFEDLPTRLMVLQQRLKYSFRNKRLLLEAITHPSIGQLVLQVDGMSADASGGDIDVNAGQPDGKKKKKNAKNVWKGDYERLEYLGDAVIEYLTLSYAFINYDTWLPGSLSQWKSATVSNDALGKTALAWFGIDECILTGNMSVDAETMERVANIQRMYPSSPLSLSSVANAGLSGVRRSRRPLPSTSNHTLPKMFADVFEALVAAVFLDCGRDLHKVRDVFMWPLLETVGKDAVAYVRHESGLAVSDLGDELMEELSFSSELDE